MKRLTATIVAIMALNVLCFAQSLDTLDINYAARYRDTLGFKWSSKLTEANGWALQGFTVGGSYLLSSGASNLTLAYDIGRQRVGEGLTTKAALRYVVKGPSTSLNFSILQTQGSRTRGGFAGRIDFETTW